MHISLGALSERVAWLADAARWAGAAFLTAYAVLAARRALSSRSTDRSPSVEPGPTASTAGAGGAHDATTRATSRAAPVALAALALTWLNPHVYLDTVFLLGSVASTHGDDRWWFALGASIASLVWFTSLGLGARWLGRYLQSPRSWRVLDGVVALIMVALAVTLLAT